MKLSELLKRLGFSKQKLSAISPVRLISASFAGVIILGTLLLMLPISARSHEVSPFLDCLFTATSATCVTGLITYDTYSHWTNFGQVVILLLIQIGGLGLVTLAAFINLMLGKKLGLRSMHLAQESVSSMEGDVRQLLGLVIKTALAVEGVGALLLAVVFVPDYGLEGIYISIFTAISAFCNAGFDLFGRHTPFQSLTGYSNNPIVLGTIGTLIIVGGIGFIIIYDILQWRKTGKLTLHTRVVLSVTLCLIICGMAGTALMEWNNPATIGPMPFFQKLGNSWFHSVSCRTAGFNAFDLASMTDSTKMLSAFLMFIGAAPGSTGGGIKCTTLAVILMTVVSVIRGKEETVIFRRRVDKGAVYKSLAVMMLGFTAVVLTTSSIMVSMQSVEELSLIDALFESVSAFATVGLSVGITGEASSIAKCLLIFSMYIGRLGPVTFFLALASRGGQRRREVLPEGKIVIG